MPLLLLAPKPRSSMRTPRGSSRMCSAASERRSCCGTMTSACSGRKVGQVCPESLLRSELLEDPIGPRQALEIGVQTVHEQRVEHVAAEMRERRGAGLPRRGGSASGRSSRTPTIEHAVRAEMNRRRQRRAVAHRAVAVELAADLHGRKHERHGGARHQMVDRERAWRGRCGERVVHDVELGPPLKERYRTRSRVRRSRDRHGVEMPLLDRTANAVEAHVARAAARAAARCRAATPDCARRGRRTRPPRTSAGSSSASSNCRRDRPGSPRSSPQTCSMSATARSKCAARPASTAALIAPADVPQMTLNGFGSRSGKMPAIAFRTPT